MMMWATATNKNNKKPLRKLSELSLHNETTELPRVASDQQGGGRPRWHLLRDIAGLFFIASALLYAVYLIVDSERQQQLEYEKRRATEQISSMRAQLEQRIQANVMVLRALRPEILWQDTPDRLRLQRIMDEFITSDLDISHLALAPDLIISFVYPLAGNQQMLGFNYRTSPTQYGDILRTVGAQDMVLTGPIKLVQGNEALVARMPIFHDDRSFWGIASLVINHQHLLDRIEFFQHPEYSFALRPAADEANGNSEREPAFAGPDTLFNQDAVTTSVRLPRAEWELAVFPRSGVWVQQHYSYLLHWSIGLALTGLIVVAFLILILTQNRLRRALHTIGYQARFDPLTDLPNRNYFQQQLESIIKTSARHEQQFAVLILDLDQLRDINDALGHAVGDELLQHVAQRIRSSIREDDLLARIGGDEFAVVLRDIDEPAQAEMRAKAIMSDLLNTLDIEHNHINMTASIGITVFPQDATAVQELIKLAELAMYAAKSTGSLSVHFFDEDLRQSTEQHIALHHQMITGLEQNEFRVYYQPVINTSTGLLTRCEALIRWHHPTRGMVSPAEFIPIAEKTGAIIWLGEFVLSQVAKDWQLMRSNDLDVTIAVNRSPREFNDREAAAKWLQVLKTADMPADRLMLEITESMLMRNKERQLANLRELRAAGVHLAIDDFGTGYSSLNYLRSYPIDIIKIDRGFLQNVPFNSQQTALVEVLIRIAHTLDMKVVAEGVETETQVDFLRSQNCHYQQGFFYGPGMPLDEFMQFAQDFNRKVLEKRGESAAKPGFVMDNHSSSR